MNTPIIRFEVEGLKQTVITAITEKQAEMDEYVQKAIDEVITPEYVEQVVYNEVEQTLNKVLKEEVKGFFGYGGKGRKVIREAVEEHLISITKKED